MNSKCSATFLIMFLSAFLAVPQLFAADDDYLVRYPDGSYGLDMGGGYETMPSRSATDSTRDNVLFPPVYYREDYKSTRLGAMTQKGFIEFPGFTFPDIKRAEKRESVFKKKQKKDRIFYESTTSTSESKLWGISGP